MALAGAPVSNQSAASLELSIARPGAPFSVELVSQLAFPSAPAYYAVFCGGAFDAGVAVGFVWLDDHLVCSTGAYLPANGSFDGSVGNPIYRRPGVARAAVVRAHLYVGAAGLGGGAATLSFSLPWCEMSAPGGACALAPIPGALLGPPGLPPAEAQRVALQRSLARGWGLWLHDSLLAAVQLPSAVRFDLHLCALAAGGGNCALRAIQDDGNVRVGLHANDRSIAQFYLAFGGANASVSVLGGGQDLQVLVEPVSCNGGADCSGYAFAVSGSMLWLRAGAISSDAASLNARPLGLPAVTLRGASVGAAPPVDPGQLMPNVTARPFLAVSLAAGAVAFSTLGPSAPSVAAVQAAAAAAAAAEVARYAHYGDALAEAAQGVQAAVSWNMIYTPAELGPFPPVSRAWSSDDPAPTDVDAAQWSYVIFAWDNMFASLLAGLTSRDLAYSSLIQAVRSKSAAGFTPNYGGGGAKSVDRTEPPLGGRVLLEFFRKFQDAWIVELLLDDFIDNLDWFWRRRRLPPLGLIALGSDPVPSYAPPDWLGVNQMQGARFESGLDNSPMYDGPSYFNNVSHQMQAYDVGMSSLFVAEAAAVATLARAVGRDADAAALEAQAAQVRALIASTLWDEGAGTFKNFITANNTLSTRVSPTSFYALAAHAATDAQAARMATEWATNASRFCLSASWPAGVGDGCFWGLPSISADDPAFPALGYWRGFVWGPMAQLTFWSFREYAHVPAVAAAQAALVAQMKAAFLEQWRLHRHVCENYDPRKGATECTGSLFYSWGALTALLSFEAAGVY